MRFSTLAFFVLVSPLALSACSRKTYKMPSGSMWPNIPVGTSVTADTSTKTPARGDVFVFKYPEHPDQSFVKRIVGLPGDRIETKGAVLTVNGKALPTCVLGRFSSKFEETVHEGELVLEGTGYLVFNEAGVVTNDGAWTVAPGEFWAMGDNRNNSHDSRSWFGGKGGGVPEAMLIGKVAPLKSTLPQGAEALGAAFEKCRKELGL